MFHDALVSFAERRGINMKKLNYTEDLLRVIFFWIGIFFLVSGVLSFLGILKPAVNSGIQNPDMLGTVFSIAGVLLCIISAALGISIIVPTSYSNSIPDAAISASAVSTTNFFTYFNSLTSPTNGIIISGLMFQSG